MIHDDSYLTITSHIPYDIFPFKHYPITIQGVQWIDDQLNALPLFTKMVIGTIATTALACLNIGQGFLAWLLGFAHIAQNSFAAWLMSAAWKSGIGIPIIAYLQSHAALFANLFPFL